MDESRMIGDDWKEEVETNFWSHGFLYFVSDFLLVGNCGVYLPPISEECIPKSAFWKFFVVYLQKLCETVRFFSSEFLHTQLVWIMIMGCFMHTTISTACLSSFCSCDIPGLIVFRNGKSVIWFLTFSSFWKFRYVRILFLISFLV